MKTEHNKTSSLKLLGKIVTVVIILLLALISFVGIYVQDKNSMKNIIPTYELGMDINGSRNILIKVDDSTETKKYDSEGNLVTDDSETSTDAEETTENKNVTEVEEPVNATELLTTDNYQAVREIIEKRLEYMNVNNYLIRLDEATGDINIEVPEKNNTDYIAQYTISKGEFKVSDNDTGEVLLTNSDLKGAKVQYSTSSSGTTVYISIQFNKEGTEKLKNISNTYISSEDAEGNDTTKKIKMMLDDETIIATYFEEEITDGLIQLSLGTSSDTSELQSYIQQASNLAVFLNTDPMPITYKMDINRFVYSDITENTIIIIVASLIAIGIVMAIVMIVKFKKNGLMGVIVNIGFIAILLLALRFGNVTITLSGIFTIAISAIIEYVITMLILEEYKKDTELIDKNIKKLLGKVAITLVPILVMAVTFALINWEEISSIGMILFWAILITVIYNIIILSIRLFNPIKIKNKKNKKDNKDNKNLKVGKENNK